MGGETENLILFFLFLFLFFCFCFFVFVFVFFVFVFVFFVFVLFFGANFAAFQFPDLRNWTERERVKRERLNCTECAKLSPKPEIPRQTMIAMRVIEEEMRSKQAWVALWRESLYLCARPAWENVAEKQALMAG